MLLDERIDIVVTYLDLVELASCTDDGICEVLKSCITMLAISKVGLSLSSVGGMLCSCRNIFQEIWNFLLRKSATGFPIQHCDKQIKGKFTALLMKPVSSASYCK
jgi:hypothetical protein